MSFRICNLLNVDEFELKFDKEELDEIKSYLCSDDESEFLIGT